VDKPKKTMLLVTSQLENPTGCKKSPNVCGNTPENKKTQQKIRLGTTCTVKVKGGQNMVPKQTGKQKKHGLKKGSNHKAFTLHGDGGLGWVGTKWVNKKVLHHHLFCGSGKKAQKKSGGGGGVVGGWWKGVIWTFVPTQKKIGGRGGGGGKKRERTWKKKKNKHTKTDKGGEKSVSKKRGGAVTVKKKNSQTLRKTKKTPG